MDALRSKMIGMKIDFMSVFFVFLKKDNSKTAICRTLKFIEHVFEVQLNPPHNQPQFSDPRFIRSLHGSQKTENRFFPQTSCLADVKALLADNKSPFTRLCLRPNVQRTSKQQCRA